MQRITKSSHAARGAVAAVALALTAGCTVTAPIQEYLVPDRRPAGIALIERGGGDRDPLGYTPLHQAAIRGDRDGVKTLLRRGADLDAHDFHGRSALMLALHQGHDALVRELIVAGAILNTPYTLTHPLFDAVIGDSAAMIDYLLDAGLDVDSVNRVGTTALQIAAAGGDVELVELLLDRGADSAIRDAEGWSALHFAGAGQHRGIVRRLLVAGARPEPLASDALAAFATGIVYEEAALAAARRSGQAARTAYQTAADHYAQAAASYRERAATASQLVVSRHASNALEQAFAVFTPAAPRGTPLGDSMRLRLPIVLPQGPVDALAPAQAAYLAAEAEALAGERRARAAAAGFF